MVELKPLVPGTSENVTEQLKLVLFVGEADGTHAERGDRWTRLVDRVNLTR